jgi:hypothetical protein
LFSALVGGTLSTVNTATTLDPRDEYAFYKALALVGLSLHRPSLEDMNAALQNLNTALSINPNDKDAVHMKILLTQILAWHRQGEAR